MQWFELGSRTGKWGVALALILSCSGDDATSTGSGDDSCTGAACCDGGCPDDEGTGVPTVSGSETGGSGTEGSGSTASSGSQSTSATGTGGDLWGKCRKACTTLTDCCPDDGGQCYFGCNGDVCVPYPCTEGGCEPLFQYNTECHAVDGVDICVPICDENCGQPNSDEGCSGMADDGFMYCQEPCTSPWIGGCPGGQTCDEQTGRCFCTASSQCGEGEFCDPLQ